MKLLKFQEDSLQHRHTVCNFAIVEHSHLSSYSNLRIVLFFLKNLINCSLHVKSKTKIIILLEKPNHQGFFWDVLNDFLFVIICVPLTIY